MPVIHVQRELNAPGGACNVALNIAALGAEASLSGVIGRDAFGDQLQEMLAEEKIDTATVLRVEKQSTIVKTRVVAEHQQVCRVDREDLDYDAAARDEAFYKLVEGGLEGVQGVVIEDYGKGVVHQELVDLVLKRAGELGIPSGYDPKDNHALQVKGVTIATPNRKEAFVIAGMPEPMQLEEPAKNDALLAVGKELMTRWGAGLVALTLGPDGVLLFSQTEEPLHIPTRAKEVYDVSGAGDTVIAVCVLALAADATPVEAIELANSASGIVVGKLGTAVCTPDEIRAYWGSKASHVG